jgi:hypothetical protein
MSHIPTIEQEKAFKSVINALKKCKKLGLVIYAKQYDLVAYTKEADDYAEEFGFEKALSGSGNQMPCISVQILQDSGADDYPVYRNKKDQDLFNPDCL